MNICKKINQDSVYFFDINIYNQIIQKLSVIFFLILMVSILSAEPCPTEDKGKTWT